MIGATGSARDVDVAQDRRPDRAAETVLGEVRGSSGQEKTAQIEAQDAIFSRFRSRPEIMGRHVARTSP